MTDSMVIYNNEFHQTIPFDDYNYNIENINNSELSENEKIIWKYISYFIQGFKSTYSEKKERLTWVKPDNEDSIKFLLNYIKLTMVYEKNTPNEVYYYVYFSFNIYLKLINIMSNGIEVIFSDIKKSKITKHPNFIKGRSYCEMALATVKNMMDEVSYEILNNTELVSKKLLEDSKLHKEFFHVSEENKHIFDSTPDYDRERFAKKLNGIMYILLLEILTPSNFLTLLMKFHHFHKTLQLNRYFNKMINNIPEPMCLPYVFSE